MSRIALIALILVAAGGLLSGCSDDATGPDRSGAAEKRLVLPPIADPPPEYDEFMFYLAANFAHHEWVKEEWQVSAKNGGTHSFVPEGYPADSPVMVEVDADPSAAVDKIETAVVWVIKPPAKGSTVYVPGNCILFKTRYLPPTVGGSAKIHVPIMDWYDTSNFTGTFTTYHLERVDGLWWMPFDQRTIQTAWPPADPDEPLYVTVTTLGDKDEPSNILDQVTDPQAPGDDP